MTALLQILTEDDVRRAATGDADRQEQDTVRSLIAKDEAARALFEAHVSGRDRDPSRDRPSTGKGDPMPIEKTPTEARQATRDGVRWILFASLAIIAVLLLVGFFIGAETLGTMASGLMG